MKKVDFDGGPRLDPSNFVRKGLALAGGAKIEGLTGSGGSAPNIASAVSVNIGRVTKLLDVAQDGTIIVQTGARMNSGTTTSHRPHPMEEPLLNMHAKLKDGHIDTPA